MAPAVHPSCMLLLVTLQKPEQRLVNKKSKPSQTHRLACSGTPVLAEPELPRAEPRSAQGAAPTGFQHLSSGGFLHASHPMVSNHLRRRNCMAAGNTAGKATWGSIWERFCIVLGISKQLGTFPKPSSRAAATLIRLRSPSTGTG